MLTYVNNIGRYTNWGFRHAPSATDNSGGTGTGQLVTLAELSLEGRSQYDPRVGGFLSEGRFTNEDGNWVYAGLDGAMASQR